MKDVVSRPEVHLNYGDPLRPAIHMPPRHPDKIAALARRFFDPAGLWSGRGW